MKKGIIIGVLCALVGGTAASASPASAASAPHYCYGGEGTNEIWAWPTTTCPFARNVYRALLRGHRGTVYTGDVFRVRAHSPVTHRWYRMRCVVYSQSVECSGGRRAHVEVIL